MSEIHMERDELRSKVDSMEHGSRTGWIQFDPTTPPPPGDYWCEVPALTLGDGGCLCRALYWTGEHWEGPGGEYEVGRYVPEMLPQLHGRGVVCEMDEGRDQWKLDAAIARISELEKERDAAIARIDEMKADNELVRRTNSLERMVTSNARPEEAASRIMALEYERDSMALRIERLSAELAKPEDERLREVTEAMVGRVVMFDDIAERVRHELHELGRWIERAGKAERELSEIRRMHSKLHDSLCRDHMHTRIQDEHACALEALAELLKQNSIQEGSRNEQASMVRTMQEIPK